ncbi:MAG: 50S ribosomal protein L18a [Thermoplasmata archaeon]|nr:50S ribosomal protein L18a [Thermoplasmata archaeon]
MAQWTVSGRFLARRNDWQKFTKTCDAASAAQAREWILSEIGGCHHVRRSLIRLDSVAEAAA